MTWLWWKASGLLFLLAPLIFQPLISLEWQLTMTRIGIMILIAVHAVEDK
jgi:hypothetical protein